MCFHLHLSKSVWKYATSIKWYALVISNFNIWNSLSKNAKTALKSSYLNFCFHTCLLTSRRSKITFFLPDVWTETIKGLMKKARLLLLHFSITPLSNKSPIASVTNQGSNKADLLCFTNFSIRHRIQRNFVTLFDDIKYKFATFKIFFFFFFFFFFSICALLKFPSS